MTTETPARFAPEFQMNNGIMRGAFETSIGSGAVWFDGYPIIRIAVTDQYGQKGFRVWPQEARRLGELLLAAANSVEARGQIHGQSAAPGGMEVGDETKLTGGSSPYYTVRIERPLSGGEPYTAECLDVIEALNMPFGLGEAFKACWRLAAQLQGRGKPGTSRLYNAEKIEFFGAREVARARAVEEAQA